MMFPVLGRLKPGTTVAQARAAFDATIETLPDVPSREQRSDWTVGILPLKELLVADVRRPLQIFAGAVLLVLLIACAAAGVGSASAGRHVRRAIPAA
jgi:hypothetical protein